MMSFLCGLIRCAEGIEGPLRAASIDPAPMMKQSDDSDVAEGIGTHQHVR